MDASTGAANSRIFAIRLTVAGGAYTYRTHAKITGPKNWRMPIAITPILVRVSSIWIPVNTQNIQHEMDTNAGARLSRAAPVHSNAAPRRRTASRRRYSTEAPP